MKTFGLAIALALLGFDAGMSHAQAPVAPCGLTSVTPGAELLYPPIARAAHVSGTVVVLSTFDQTGKMIAAKVFSGPEMLRYSTVEYLKHLRANEFTGPRECAVAVTFRIIGVPHECKGEEPRPSQKTTITDPQHIVIEYPSLCFVTMY